MKKLSIFTIALFTLLSFTTVSADNTLNTYNLAGTNVSIGSKGKSLVIYLDNTKSELVSVNIVNDNGDKLVSEAIMVSKKYNMNNLPSGNYSVTVTRKNAKTIQPFEITNSAVIIAEQQKKAYFTPKIIQKGDRIAVNALAGQYTNMTVSITDSEGKAVFTEPNYVVLSLHKSYNISSLTKGSYTLSIMAGDEVYTQAIEKK